MPQKVKFRYDALDAAVSDKVSEHAAQIHQVLERTSAGIIEIGKRLIAVRAALTPEQFKAWLIGEFQWNVACATTYETAAEKFANVRFIERFHPSAIYMLCRTALDPRVFKEATKRAERGDTVSRMVVAKLIRKFLPPRPAVAAALGAADARDLARAPVQSTALITFRSFLRRMDVTEIPADERAALADELLELAMQLRTGRMRDGAPVSRIPDVPDAPARLRPARRELVAS